MVADLGAVHEADPAETLFGMARKDGGIVEGAEAHPFLHDTLDIDIGDGQRGLSQKRPDSAIVSPSSWIRPWPSQDRSVVLSPIPAAE